MYYIKWLNLSYLSIVNPISGYAAWEYNASKALSFTSKTVALNFIKQYEDTAYGKNWVKGGHRSDNLSIVFIHPLNLS